MPLHKGDPEFTLEVDGKEFKFWESLVFRRAIDAADAVTFTAPFDPDSKEHRELFRPTKYKEVILRFGGKKVFTGFSLSPTPTKSKDATRVTISAISKCGVWQDCTLPASVKKFQFDKQNLKKIATALGEPWGLSPKFGLEQPGSPFDKAAIEVDQKILEFLAPLAKQRGFVIGADDDGNPLFWKSVDLTPPIAEFKPDSQPAFEITANIDDQALYSEVTGFAKTKHGATGNSYTESNFHVSSALRPLSVSLDDTPKADVPAAVQTQIARTFAEACSYTLRSATIYDKTLKKLYDRNQIVRVKDPKVMIYKPFDFLIRAVTFNVTKASKASTLELVIPEAFKGVIPEALPWDEPGLF